MSILTETIKDLKLKLFKSSSLRSALVIALFMLTTLNACQPKEDVVLRRINDVIVDASTEPLLRANAILYNPNNIKMKLRKIDMEVFVNDKSSATIDQKLDMKIPAKSEFTVPLEVKLNMKEVGLLNTIFNVIGGRKIKVRYKGSISITYKAVPVRIPVDYEEEIKVKF